MEAAGAQRRKRRRLTLYGGYEAEMGQEKSRGIRQSLRERRTRLPRAESAASGARPPILEKKTNRARPTLQRNVPGTSH
jgi:hypothetical protein